MKILHRELGIAALVSALGMFGSAVALADHEPVDPFQLFVDRPNLRELPEDQHHRLHEPAPLANKRSPLQVAEEELERQRIEEFKRQHALTRDILPELSDDRAERLRELFEILQETNSKKLAKRAEKEIQRVWSSSGSDTIDLLLSWANKAMQKRDFAQALDFLDNIIVLDPDFAEAWNRRATLHFVRKDFARSIADVQKTLSLEPRHFGALSGLGIMMRELGHEAEALHAFDRALDVNPNLDRIRKAAAELEKKVRGRDS